MSKKKEIFPFLFVLLALILCACSAGGKRDNTYTITGVLQKIDNSGFELAVISDESGELNEGTEIYCYFSGEYETNAELTNGSLYVSGIEASSGDVLSADYLYYYLETSDSGYNVSVFNICIPAQESETKDYTLTQEGVSNCLLNADLLVKDCTENEATIYTLANAELSELMSLIDINEWNGKTEIVRSENYMVFRLAEKYEVCLFENGNILVYNGYADDTEMAYYESNIQLDEIRLWMKSKGSVCEDPWGAFVN